MLILQTATKALRLWTMISISTDALVRTRKKKWIETKYETRFYEIDNTFGNVANTQLFFQGRRNQIQHLYGNYFAFLRTRNLVTSKKHSRITKLKKLSKVEPDQKINLKVNHINYLQTPNWVFACQPGINNLTSIPLRLLITVFLIVPRGG